MDFRIQVAVNPQEEVNLEILLSTIPHDACVKEIPGGRKLITIEADAADLLYLAKKLEVL